MKKEKKRNRYEEQKERREREQREKEAREQRRKAAQRRRREQAGTGNGYAGVEKKTAEPWKSTAGTAKNQADIAPTWVNTAGPGGGAELWKQVKLEPGETAADYYEKKRKQREADRKETDAAFSRALEETQKELREQRLGVAEGFGRKKRYNRNYEDLFGLPEGGDFRSRVKGNWGPHRNPMKWFRWGRGGARRREEFPLLRKQNRADFAHGKLGPRTTRAKRVVWGKGGAAQGASFRREAEAKQKGARRRE